MTRKLLFALCIALACAFSVSSVSRAQLQQVEELIIMIPDAESGRNDHRITNALTSIPGVEVVGYCNSQKCFFLHIDRDQQPDNRNVINTIRSLGYGMEIKISGTIQEAQNNCADRN